MAARSLGVWFALATVCLGTARAGESEWGTLTPTQRAGWNLAAGAVNVMPVVSSAATDSRCLAGYVACKALFAGFSVLTATSQLIFSGGGDLEQTKNLLRRGFGGDWYVTGEQVSGNRPMDVYPPATPPKPAGSKTFEPPPR